MNTQARTLNYIRNVLTNDAQSATKAPGGIYQTVAPSGTATVPWVVYQQYTPLPDIQARGGQLVMGKGQILVAAVGPASQDQAITDCADWFDGLLNTALASFGGATIIRIVRYREFGPVDEFVQPGGVLYTRAGFIYQWWAQ